MEKKVSNFTDYLTEIYNENYLKEHYHEYLSQNPNSFFVMIDFKNFKSINDTFGHSIGDQYLKTFAKILQSNFSDSIAVRLHGDEFAILTKFSEDHIEKRFQLCNLKISVEVNEGNLPRIFSFNAGSTKAEMDLEETKKIADIMMYSAKQNGSNFQRFNETIYKARINQKMYIKKVEETLNSDSFSYTGRKLFQKNKSESNIEQIYTKNTDGNSLFNNGRYNILKSSSILLKFDIYNIQNLLENFPSINQKMMITIDFKSLLFSTELINSLILLKDISNLNYENVILNINILGINSSHYQSLLNKLAELRKLGFSICLDKYSSNIGDVLWENSDIQYIKLISSYWKEAMKEKKKERILEYKINMYSDFLIMPIFDYVETEQEHDFLYRISSNNVLLSGNFYSQEEKLTLIKK